MNVINPMEELGLNNILLISILTIITSCVSEVDITLNDESLGNKKSLHISTTNGSAPTLVTHVDLDLGDSINLYSFLLLVFYVVSFLYIQKIILITKKIKD